MNKEPKKQPMITVGEMEQDPGVAKGRARNIEMFKDYFKGMRISEISVKYGLSRQRVDTIKRRDKWESVSQEIQDRAYAKLSYEWKDFLGKVTLSLKKDWERVMKKLITEENTLTPDERTHGRMLLDHLVKASRLADDKPTEIAATSGVVEHRVLLPEGVKRFGVIPPNSNVNQVEHKESDKDKPKLTPEDVGDID